MSLVSEFGSIAFNLVYNALGIFVLVILLVALFFGWRYWKKFRQKSKSYKQLQALVIKKDGTWFIDNLGYFNHADKVDKLHMKKAGHTIPVLPSNCVRGGQCILFNYAPTQYAAIPCSLWDRINLKQFGIEVVNLQMKNFVYLEQRAAVSRWQYVKDLMTKWAPWITFVIVAAVVCIALWFLMKFGLELWQNIVAARTADCAKLIPELQNTISIPKP